ncbi:toll-like receptor 4 [Octopus bimaculoides]|uniref:LRRCT domain-containing protein n=1 Tax=Octopus bimaculoides TaxID=37653 RepID=A0A0L8HLF4_OCTBM|nr:toll-like receptor 4 [Octopus bimaculoides]|eukprot:XP_014771677.1 PREDICTED: toll-like receptor 4 [Octopus bimaculoides]
MKFNQLHIIWILQFQVAALALNEIINIKHACNINNFKIICEYIDLHNKRLNFEQLNGTYMLYLTRTNLHSLQENVFNGTQIKHLSIYDNPLTVIDKNAFGGQEDFMKSLELSTTDTTELVDFTALQNLYNLETLEIENFYMNQNLNNFTSNKLTKLTKLSLINNKICDININTFAHFQNLTHLTIKNNKLAKMLHPEAFEHLLNIQYLDVSNNAITDITMGNLENVKKKLQHLDLSSNKITHDHLKHFKNLSKLETLKLDNNRIKSLSGDIFQNMNTLNTLSVRNNQLTKLRKTYLNGLNNLRELFLNRNQLIIEATTMTEVPLLEILYLDNQNLKGTMEIKWLENTSGTLKKLSLKGNSFNNKDLWTAIQTLPHLEILDLSKCNLAVIAAFAFEKNSKLKVIKLNDNKIETLEEGAFQGLQNTLESIKLSNNQLQVVDECVFNNFTWPEKEYFNIDLNNNKLVCNCSLRWLQIQLNEYIKKSNNNTVPVSFWKCLTINGKELIVNTNLTCDSSKTNCQDFRARYTIHKVILTKEMLNNANRYTETKLETSSITTPKSFRRPLISLKLERQLSNVVRISWNISDLFWVKDFTLQIKEILPNQEWKIQSQPIHKLRQSQVFRYSNSESILHICIIVNVIVKSNLIDACDTLHQKKKEDSPSTSNKNTLEIGLGIGVFVALLILLILCYVLYRRHKNNKKHIYEEPTNSVRTQVNLTQTGRHHENRTPNETKIPAVTVISHGQLQPDRQLSTRSYQYLDTGNFRPENTYEAIKTENSPSQYANVEETRNYVEKRTSLQDSCVDNFQYNRQIPNQVKRPLPYPPSFHNNGANINEPFYYNTPLHYAETTVT